MRHNTWINAGGDHFEIAYYVRALYSTYFLLLNQIIYIKIRNSIVLYLIKMFRSYCAIHQRVFFFHQILKLVEKNVIQQG